MVSSGASALTILLSLITTPVLLHSLGLTGYGALAVIGSLTAYIGVFDFGISGSLARYMTLYEERGDRRAIAGVATFACVFYGAMAAILFPLLYFAAPAIARILSFPADLQEDLPSLLMMLLGIFFAANLSGILGSRLTSIHRLDVGAYIGMGTSVASVLLIITMVPRYPSLYTVFACNFVQILISSAGMCIALAKLTGRPPISFGRVSWPEMRDLLSFGFWTQLNGITAILNLEADKVIISRYLGVADVAPYQVANRIALLNRVFPLQLIGAMLPEVTARVSRGLSSSDLELLYERSSRALMLATMFISGFVAGAADGILRFWLGARLPWAAELCVALVLSYIVNNATGVGTTVIKAQGKPQLETTYGMVAAALNIGLTLMLIKPFGLFGVVAGTILGNVAGSAYFLIAFHRRTGLPWWQSMGRWLVKLTLMMFGAGSSAFAISRALGHDEMSRFGLLPSLIAAALLYVLVFALLGYLLRFWTADDYAYAGKLWDMLRLKRSAG